MASGIQVWSVFGSVFLKDNNVKGQLKDIDNTAKETENSMNNSFASIANNAGGSFVNFGSKLESVGENIAKIGTKMSLGITTPIVGAVAAVAKLTMSFDDGMAKISTIADTTQVSLSSLGNSLLDLSNKTGKSISDLQEGEYQAISSGISTADSINFMNTAAEASVGGFTDVATSVDGLTTVLNAYNLSGQQANDIANQMMVAQNLGKTTFGDMAKSIGLVADTTANMNINTKDLFSSLAVMTAHGIDTSEAVSGLREAMSNIIKPTKDASAQAQALGLDFSAAHLKSVGWAAFLKEIADKTHGNTQEMGNLFGSVQALNSMITLTSESGMTLFNQSLQQMSSNTNYVDDAFNKVNSSSGKTLANIFNQIKNSAVTFGETLENLHSTTLTNLANSISNLINKFNSMSDTQRDAVAKFAGLSAALGPATIGIGKLFEGVGKLDKGFGEGLKSITKFTGDSKTKITDFATSAVSGIGKLGDLTPINLLVKGIGSLGSKAQNAATLFVSALSKMAGNTKSLLGSGFDSLFDKLPQKVQLGMIGVTTAISKDAPLLSNGLKSTGQKIVSGLGSLMTTSLKLFAPAAIIGLIITGLGLVDSKMGDQITKMIQSIAAKAPSLISSFVQKVQTKLPELMQMGINLLLQVINGITSVLPQLIQAAAAVISQLVLGLVKALPQLIPAALNLIFTLAKAIVDNLPTIIEAGIQLIVGLVKGLTANPEKLVDTIVNLVTEIVTVLIQHLPELIEAGVEIIIALAVGLVKAIPEIIKDLPQIISAMMNAFKSADWGGLGSSIIQGIAQGLKALGGALVDTLKNIGLDALNGFKSLFGIHSPSTVFAEMGGHMVQGLINGLNDGKENVNNTLGNLIDDTSLNATIKVGSQNLAINYDIDSGANVRNTNATPVQQGSTFHIDSITIQAQDHNDVANWFRGVNNQMTLQATTYR